MQAEILKSLFKVHTLWGERSRQCEVKNSMHNSEAISQVAEQSLCICIESSEVLIFWRISPTRKRFSTEVCSGEENPSSKEGVFDKFKLKKKNKTAGEELPKMNCKSYTDNQLWSYQYLLLTYFNKTEVTDMSHKFLTHSSVPSAFTSNVVKFWLRIYSNFDICISELWKKSVPMALSWENAFALFGVSPCHHYQEIEYFKRMINSSPVLSFILP